MKEKATHNGCTFNGVILHVIFTLALLSLEGCKTQQKANISETTTHDTILVNTHTTNTQNDTITRTYHIYKDTVLGGVQIYEKIVRATNTVHDTLNLQATTKDIKQTTPTTDKQSKHFSSTIIYITLFIIILCFLILCLCKLVYTLKTKG